MLSTSKLFQGHVTHTHNYSKQLLTEVVLAPPATYLIYLRVLVRLLGQGLLKSENHRYS
jgi:hypothetical protein